MNDKIHKLLFAFRFRLIYRLTSAARKLWYMVQGMQIGKGTALPKFFVTWPHQIRIGNNCILEHNISFKFDGIWMPGPRINIGDRVFIGNGCEFNIKKGLHIGNDSLIASGCKFIDHNHGVAKSKLTRQQPQIEETISIGSNVWIGCNSVILKGVTVGEGAVIAAGSVVNKDISPNTIAGGVPAKLIKQII